MGLTSDQERVKNEVLLALQNEQPKDFIVQGTPGSGKTLLAVSLLLKAIERNHSCILAIRNNRLQAILQKIFNQAYPGATGLMMYFEPRQGIGIAQFDGHVDLLICDEAQRMESRIMPNVLSKAKVSAIFLDETQRLNPPEQGTLQNFAEASLENGRTPMPRTLSTSLRVPLGYAHWVEEFLRDPASLRELDLREQPWRDEYLFKVCTSFTELRDSLAELRSGQDRVALVASFTESPGKSKVTHPDNLRIGYPLTSGFDLYQDTDHHIPWLMTASHYRQFWSYPVLVDGLGLSDHIAWTCALS